MKKKAKKKSGKKFRRLPMIFGGANAVVAEIGPAVTDAVGAMRSATVLINGFAARLQAAIDQALANGATEAELAPITAELADLRAGTAELAAAVAANPA